MAVPALFVATVALYAAASILHLGYVAGWPARAVRPARALLVAAFVAHMVEIGARGVAGLHPATSVTEALGFLAWVLCGGYLLAQIRRPLAAAGALVAPTTLVMLLAARLVPDTDRSMVGLGALGRIHISLATVGVSIFTLATALAALYLMEERQLKHKRMGLLIRKGAALETLDHLVHRCVQVGFPIFTVAIVTGAIWSARLADGFRPEYTIAVVAWGAFAALLVARTTAGWRGRRAALLTIAGFAAALSVLGAYVLRAVGG